MTTSDQDQPQGQEQEQARGGAQSHATEGGADRAASRHGGRDRGGGRRRPRDAHRPHGRGTRPGDADGLFWSWVHNVHVGELLGEAA
jgi:hypothetical protein